MKLTAEEARIVRTSFANCIGIEDEIASLFYSRLFDVEPSLERLFKNTEMEDQERKLMRMMAMLIHGLNQWEEVTKQIEAMGRRHVSYGVKLEHYQIVGEALIWAMGCAQRPNFTPDVKSAWEKLYQNIVEIVANAIATEPHPVQ